MDLSIYISSESAADMSAHIGPINVTSTTGTGAEAATVINNITSSNDYETINSCACDQLDIENGSRTWDLGTNADSDLTSVIGTGSYFNLGLKPYYTQHNEITFTFMDVPPLISLT